MITDELLNELEQKEKAATPGPWDVRHEFNVFSEKRSVANCGGHSSNVNPGDVYDHNRSNAVLVAAARNALPDLLAEVRKLRAENAALRAENRMLSMSFDQAMKQSDDNSKELLRIIAAGLADKHDTA